MQNLCDAQPINGGIVDDAIIVAGGWMEKKVKKTEGGGSVVGCDEESNKTREIEAKEENSLDFFRSCHLRMCPWSIIKC